MEVNMPVIPEVIEMLNRINEIHQRKNEDYAAQPFENFIRSAALASWFKFDSDKSFVVLIGTKLARLATLLNKGVIPNNESVDDSFLDLATYCILWAAYYQSKNAEMEEEEWTDLKSRS